MLSQKSVRVEQLDLVKPRYNQFEKQLWLLTKGRIWLAAILQIYIVVIIFVPSADFYYVVMA